MTNLKTVKTERRLYPRIRKKLPLRVASNGYNFITTTRDLSCTGAYCHINKYLPPFTKIAVKMTLPIIPSMEKETLECKGVVVRTDDDKDNGFNIAIFFNDMTDIQRKKISHYISQFLPHGPS